MLKKIRKILKEKSLDYALFLTADYHLSEYIPEHFKIREKISGFSGSAGSLLVGLNNAYLFTDGRYFLQAEHELNEEIKLIKNPNYIGFINQNCTKNRLYLDLQTISYQEYLNISEDIELVSDFSFIDLLDKTPLPKSKIYKHEKKFCGLSSKQKISNIQKYLLDEKLDYCIISSLSDIAYLTNLRGFDIAYNPVFLSYMIISKKDAILYIDKDKLSEKLNIKTKNYDDFMSDIFKLKGNILCDFANTNAKIILSLNATLHNQILPSTMQKALKTPKEIRHIRQAHIQDGIALCEFDYWLKHNKEPLDELKIAKKLYELRQKQANFVSESFATIAGFNANGAIIHYEAKAQNYSKISKNGLLLVDSGAQYLNGTTDVTRVFKIGDASDEQKRDYTAVLKAHIAISSLIFPKDTKPFLLDSIARKELWRLGFDYFHGTGHGVGYFLNVHEAPINLSLHAQKNCFGFRAGAVCSIEPGLYHKDKYGIRLENLIVCLDHSSTEYGDFLRFEPLTCFYFERDLIDAKLLEKSEKDWLNAYHKEVFKKLKPFFSGEMLEFLRLKTKKIK